MCLVNKAALLLRLNLYQRSWAVVNEEFYSDVSQAEELDSVEIDGKQRVCSSVRVGTKLY